MYGMSPTVWALPCLMPDAAATSPTPEPRAVHNRAQTTAPKNPILQFFPYFPIPRTNVSPLFYLFYTCIYLFPDISLIVVLPMRCVEGD